MPGESRSNTILDFINGNYANSTEAQKNIIDHPAFNERLKELLEHNTELKKPQVNFFADSIVISSYEQTSAENTTYSNLKSVIIKLATPQQEMSVPNLIIGYRNLEISGPHQDQKYTTSMYQQCFSYDSNNYRICIKTFSGNKTHDRYPDIQLESIPYSTPVLGDISNDIFKLDSNARNLIWQFDRIYGSHESRPDTRSPFVEQEQILIEKTDNQGKYIIEKINSSDSIDESLQAAYGDRDMRHNPYAKHTTRYGYNEQSTDNYEVIREFGGPLTQVPSSEYQGLKQAAAIMIKTYYENKHMPTATSSPIR